MKQETVGLLLGCALICGGTSGQVFAAETASATLGNLQIQVVSLAPGGGSVSLAAGNVSYYSYNGTAYNNSSVDGPLGTPLAISYQDGPTFAGSANITSGDPFAANGGPSAYASASAAAPNAYMQTYAYLMVGQFVIGPQTRLTFTANASTSISASSLNANDFASATIQISDATGANVITWDYSLIYTDFGGQLYDFTKPTLRVVLDNDTDVSVTRYAYISSRASIVMGPVPEPSTYALALVGLCALGYRVRKQVPASACAC